jgi:hypothetical protein
VGNWQGRWTDIDSSASGPASLVITLADPQSFRFDSSFESIFGCTDQDSTVSATVSPGIGPNHWNSDGFSIDTTTPTGGKAKLNYDFARQSLDGNGVPGCRPSVSWVLTGGFAGNSFSGAVTTALGNGSTAHALLSLARSP